MKRYPVITSVEVTGDHTLRVSFTDGVVHDLDMTPLVGGTGIWAPLADPAYFSKVRVDREGNTIVWPNGADICPDILHGDHNLELRQR